MAGMVACLVVVGCDEAEVIVVDGDQTPVSDDVTYRVLVDNGEELNGPQLNGIRVNGIRVNGIRVNGIRVNGIRVNGTSVNNFTVSNGSRITGEANAVTVTGSQLNQTEFDMDYEPEGGGDPEPRKIKVFSVVQSAEDPETYFNDVRYLQTAPDTWDYLCRDGAGNPTEAIALSGRWDNSTATYIGESDGFTWACRGAALAKAVEWKYAPWKTHSSQSLRPFHQAAVRMIRADYCGTGVTHTVNGNPIDVSDKLGLQTPGTSWPVEAKWGPDGAVCLNNPRRAIWSRATIIAECQAAGKGTLPYCTDNDPSEFGGLLMTQANVL